MARSAGAPIAHKDVAAAASTYSAQTCGSPEKAFAASRPETAIRPTSVRKTSLRRSTRSAIVPPIAEKASSGTASQIESRPTWSVDPVSEYSWNGTATNVTMFPRYETAWPHQSRRKSRDSRRGRVSIANERRRANRPGRSVVGSASSSAAGGSW